MLQGRCIRLFTPQISRNKRNSETTQHILSLPDAQHLCSEYGGWVIQVDVDAYDILQKFLLMWNHDAAMGDIWIDMRENEYTACTLIKVINAYFFHHQQKLGMLPKIYFLETVA